MIRYNDNNFINIGGEKMNKYEVVVFNDEDLSLEVNIDKDKETVWLTQEQIASLFEVDRTRVVDI
jgi:predicted XRE-type DNA-binding protein